MSARIDSRLVDDLKTEHPFAAGALARSLGIPRSYGCHFGMRSSLDHCRSEFYCGWDAMGAAK